jgi:uncharacterized phage-associated protein
MGDQMAEKCIDFVWNTFAQTPSTELSNLTHATDAPWSQARDTNTFGLKNFAIPNENIRIYFQNFVKS